MLPSSLQQSLFLSKHLAKTLKPLVGNTTSYIKDSTHFIQEIHILKLDDNDMLVSFDVVSLYRKKISVEEVLKVLNEITIKEITNMVAVCLKSTYFTF